MNILMSTLFVLLLLTVVIALIIGLIQPKLFTKFFKARTNRKTIGLVFGLAIVLLLILIQVTAPPVTKTTTTTTPTPTSHQLNYEKIEERLEGSVAVITIYTTETEDNYVIALNDKLLDEYKKGRTHIFIRYFNDKDVARTYFNKGVDEVISDEELSHYIADMKYNTESGYKVLNKTVNGNQQELKTY